MGNLGQPPPDRDLEYRSAQGEAEIEVLTLADKVLVQLAAHRRGVFGSFAKGKNRPEPVLLRG